MKVNIFYSWQNTTNRDYNHYFIRDCINEAVKIIERYPEFQEVDFEFQDGVRGIAGTPSIANTIMNERIPECDIYIADLSIVNRSKLLERLAKENNEVYPLTINNNVLIEFGIAYHSLNSEQIICVLNNYYGSPLSDPNIFPFDLRPLRAPIEYCLSEENFETKKDESRKLIGLLTKALKASTLSSLTNKRNKYRPFLTWNEWRSNHSVDGGFIENDIITQKFNLIQKSLNNNDSIRIIGLSGLGKTRLIYEFFNPTRLKEEEKILTSKLLYFNCNSAQNFDFNTIFQKISDTGEKRILVLDNCDKSIHRLALNYKLIQLLSIDSNPEESERDSLSDVTYIRIKKSDLTSLVETLIERDFNFLNPEQKMTIKHFSQGIPLMAVLLANSVKNGEKFLGKLKQNDLLNNLLGKKGSDTRNRRILQTCSLFNNFGYYDGLRSQLRFMAVNKSITPIDGDTETVLADFMDVCSYYLEREIFERKGRFIGIRPFPLSILLTTEWLETCDSERILKIINDIDALPEPDRTNLSEALAEQMKFLGFSEKATSIIDNITKIGSPFDSSEVLNTELGSRFFRSFSQVNPMAIANNLYRLFSNKSKAELLEVIKGRRNLIWTLETLCFDKRSFEKGIKSLYSFAVAENESWSNNATGQFLQLFHIGLAGTEVNLEERWKILEWGLNKDSDYKQLAFRAMRSAISNNFNRTVGAEYQGLSKLKDYEADYPQVSEYWGKILNKLFDIYKSADKEYSDLAKEIIGDSIRTVANSRLFHLIMTIVEEISKLTDYKWDEGLKNLKLTLKYEKVNLLEEERSRIHCLIAKLEDNYDFSKKYSNVYDSYFLDDKYKSYSENIINVLNILANDFVDKNISWDDNLILFYTVHQPFSYEFGKALAKRYSEYEIKLRFIDFSILKIKSIPTEKVTVGVLAGFISEFNQKDRDSFYKIFQEDESLSPFLFDLISLNEEDAKYLENLFFVAERDLSLINKFTQLSYGKLISNLNETEIKSLLSKLFSFKNDGVASVFNLINYLTYNNEALKQTLLPVLKNCINKLGIIYNNHKSIDRYNWYHSIFEILINQNDPKFAKMVNLEIINSISFDHPLQYDSDIMTIYDTLFEKYIDYIWTDIGNALLSENDSYIKFYTLKNLLGAHIGGIFRQEGLIAKLNHEKLIEWCKTSLLAQSRIAELIPIFAGENNDYTAWHPLTLKLINEFGSNEEMLSSLSSNMGSYSWTGSVVPLMTAQRDLVAQLVDHSIMQVAEWAKNKLIYLEKRIEAERNFDQEIYL